MARCKFCQKEISWIKEGRKNVPIESDGTVHRCQEMINARNSFRKIERTSLSAEEIKKYEEAMNNQVNKANKRS